AHGEGNQQDEDGRADLKPAPREHQEEGKRYKCDATSVPPGQARACPRRAEAFNLTRYLLHCSFPERVDSVSGRRMPAERRREEERETTRLDHTLTAHSSPLEKARDR